MEIMRVPSGLHWLTKISRNSSYDSASGDYGLLVSSDERIKENITAVPDNFYKFLKYRL